MNEQPKINTSPSVTKSRLRIWLVVMAVIFVPSAIAASITGGVQNSHDWFPAVILAILFSTFATLCLWLCCRWFSSWRVMRQLLFALACLITLIGLFYAEEDWRGWHDWNQFRHQWEAKGEHFDLASVVPPPVPDDQNFALTPLVSTSYGYLLDRTGHQIVPSKTNWNNRLEMYYYAERSTPPATNGDWTRGIKMNFSGLQRYYQALAAKTNLFAVPAQPQSPAADVLLALSKFAPTIEELRQDALLPASRFPLEYAKDDPAAILLPHLAALKQAGTVLQLRALAEADTGHNDQAVADLKLLQRLTESVRTEPFLVSQLVRTVMTRMVIQAIWEALADRRWADPQLAELDAGLAKLDFLADYKLAMHGEVGLQAGIIHYLHDHPAQYDKMFQNFDDKSPDESAANFFATSAHVPPSGSQRLVLSKSTDLRAGDGGILLSGGG